MQKAFKVHIKLSTLGLSLSKGLGLFLLLFSLFMGNGLYAQKTVSLCGQIIDSLDRSPLYFASVNLDSNQTGVFSDEEGYFHLHEVPLGAHQLCIRYLGYPQKCVKLLLKKDENIIIQLKRSDTEIEAVEIEGIQQMSLMTSQKISQSTIAEHANLSLADQISQIAGVEVLRTGATIGKPIIHGLYGKRLAILNNGVAQSGQQWGNDHAPEIDPMTAKEIEVVKGVGSLTKMSSSLGAMVILRPGTIVKRKGLHARFNYLLQTNGWGHTSNLQLEKYNKILPWRITASFKRMGDRSAANYYLNNTGLQEANIALQIEKNWALKWRFKGYYSLFSSNIGILRGAHIGNLTDLELALGRDVPFFTEDRFSYQIENPFQKVQHHLLKLDLQHFVTEQSFWELNYAVQLNYRREFDARRGSLNERPALSLFQWNHFAEFLHHYNWNNGIELKSGIQAALTDNTNLPETGRSPLIPDYFQYDAGLFTTLSQRVGKWNYELGARFSTHLMDVYFINDLREVQNNQHLFYNWNAAAAVKYQTTKALSLGVDLGYVERRPDISELYSDGLHQGVSGIEEGDLNLNKEKALKSSFSLNWNYKKRLNFSLNSYIQHIKDYIYLQAQDSLRLTIRGAFPVFKYQQTDALLLGSDIELGYSLTDALLLGAQYSFIYAQNLKQEIGLVNIPANRLKAKLQYDFALGDLKHNQLEVNGQYVFRQNLVLAEQDFVAPPPAYFLLGASFSTSFNLKKTELKTFLKATNLLNQSYRDYLNRQRYFADDLGINIVLGINLSF